MQFLKKKLTETSVSYIKATGLGRPGNKRDLALSESIHVPRGPSKRDQDEWVRNEGGFAQILCHIF